jgi:hypothetical protein
MVQITTAAKGFTRQCVEKEKKKKKKRKAKKKITGGRFSFSLSFQGRTYLDRLLWTTLLTGSAWETI